MRAFCCHPGTTLCKRITEALVWRNTLLLCQIAIESPFRTPVMTSIVGDFSFLIVGSWNASSISIGMPDEDDVEVIPMQHSTPFKGSDDEPEPDSSIASSGSLRSDVRPRQKRPTRSSTQMYRLHRRGLSDPTSSLRSDLRPRLRIPQGLTDIGPGIVSGSTFEGRPRSRHLCLSAPWCSNVPKL